MIKFGLATIFLLAIGVTLQAQTRNCTCLQTPYTPNPPCFQECTINLLDIASFEQFKSMLGTSDSTAAKVIERRKKGARSLQDYQEVLTPDEFNALVTRINSLRPDQLREFYGNRSEELRNPLEPGIRPLPNEFPITDSATVNSTKTETTKGAKGGATLTGGSGLFSAKTKSKTASRPHSTGYYCFKNSKGRWSWQLEIDDKHILAKSALNFDSEQECRENIQLAKASSDAPILTR